MWLRFLSSVVLFFGVVNAHAQQSVLSNLDTAGNLPIFVDCSGLRDSTLVNCLQLNSDIFGQEDILYRRVSNRNDATVVVTIQDQSQGSGRVEFTLTFTPAARLRLGSFSMNPLIDETQVDDIAARNELVRVFNQAIEFITKYAPSSAEPGGGNPTTWQDRLAKSPFFMTIDVRGDMGSSGAGQYQSKFQSASGDLNVVYSTDRNKVDFIARIESSSQSVPNGQGGVVTGTGERKFIQANIIRSFHEHWSLAVINMGYTEPNSNIKSATSNGIGVEWALVPFRQTQNKELSFRVGFQESTMQLHTPNMRGNTFEMYSGVFAQIYTYWMFSQNRATLSLSAGVDQNLNFGGYEKYSLTGSFSVRINRSMRINLFVTGSQTRKSISFPANPDFSNPLQAQSLGRPPGPSLYFRVGINYTIGNMNRKSRDRRWVNP